MSKQISAGTGNAKPRTGKTVSLLKQEGKSAERQRAEFGMSPVVGNVATASSFAKGSFGALELADCIDVMDEKVGRVKAGDLSDVEATLTAQAVTLDAIFNELARRAALNMGQHMAAAETYLRLAFKAQAQCRSTLETLAEVKNPRQATFVRQQNFANQQQVNNGGGSAASVIDAASAKEKKLNSSNELLESQNGKRLDGRTTCTTIDDDPGLEAVGKIYRPSNKQREAAQ